MVEDSGGGGEGEMRSHQFTVSKGKYYVPSNRNAGFAG